MQQQNGAPESSATRLRYMPGLDGLRGLAVVAVVLFHAGHLPGGYLGVDVFFVLSGYLITSLLLAEGTRSGTVRLGRFWGRRARRLLPALGVTLLGVGAYAAFVAQPEELHRIRWDGLATMLYVANWRDIFAGSDYWALFTAPSPLAHTWSLAIEEQFYVVWPLVVLAVLAVVRRRRVRNAEATGDAAAAGSRTAFAPAMLGLCLALGALSLASQAWWQHAGGWNRVYYGTDTRAFALLCGAALASFTAWRDGKTPVSSTRDRHRWVWELCGAVGAVVLGIAFFTVPGDSIVMHRGGLALCSISGALIVASVSRPKPGFVARLLTIRPLIWLGLISYGVYLYHWPIAVWLSPERVGLSGWPLLAVQSSVTLAVAVLSYRFIEQPIRHGSGWSLPKLVTVPSVGFALVGLVLVAATVTSLPQTTDVSTDALREASKTTVPPGGKTVMVIGNSVGWYLAGTGFDKIETDPPIRVVNSAHPNCQYPPAKRPKGVGPVPEGPCDRKWEETAKAYDADYVVFARNGLNQVPILVDGKSVTPCSTAYHDYYADALHADVDRFAKVGATTVLVTSAPSVQRFGMTDENYQAYLKSMVCGNQVLRDVPKADPEHTRLVDLYAHLCPTVTTCRKTLDGVELRHDGTHYRDAGAQVVAAWILQQVGIDASPGT